MADKTIRCVICRAEFSDEEIGEQAKLTKCPDCDGGYYEGAVPLTRCKTCGGTGIKSKEEDNGTDTGKQEAH